MELLTIRYTYDPNGNLTSLTPPGREAHVFAYEEFGVRVTTQDE